MKPVIQYKDNGSIVLYIPENGAYVLFEPLAKTNDNQNYNITLKGFSFMELNGKVLSLVENREDYIKDEMKNTLNTIKDNIEYLIKSIK